MQRHDSPVDPREAEEIVRLAAQRQGAPLNDGPTVGGLAEALGLPPEEVERLLAEVRSRQTAAPQRRFGDRSAALSAALVLALVLVVGVVGFGGYMMFGRSTPPPIPLTPGVTITGPGGEVIAVHPREGVADAAVAPSAPPTPAVPSEAEIRALSEAALRQAIAALRQESLIANTDARRAEIDAALKEAQEQLKREFGKDS